MDQPAYLYKKDGFEALLCAKCATTNPSNTHGVVKELSNADLNAMYAENITICDERPAYCELCQTPIVGRK
jgi:hypothetical protein